MEKFMLKNKKAVITGASSGIGKEIAKEFIKNNADVVIIGTNAEKLEKTLNELQELKTDSKQKIVSKQLDVSKFSDVNIALEDILKDFQDIDILINNAGITKDNLLLRMSEQDWDRVIDVNLKSIYNTCKAVIRPMMKKRSGKIINVTSVVGLIGNAGQANYAASKAGMIGFTKSLAKELAKKNIHVNAIAPGFIETQMTDVLPEKIKEELLNAIPLGRLGEPKDIAKVALFLASDMSNYITGQVIAVDGGMVM
jgi:3-oxoacyl-[acyl-carrier protein] reductase